MLLLPQSTCCSEGVANFDLMKIKLIYPIQHIVHRGWRILIPYEDKVDVITPVNILFIGGGGEF